MAKLFLFALLLASCASRGGSVMQDAADARDRGDRKEYDRLLREEVKQHPEDDMAQFELGNEAMALRQFDRAEKYFSASLKTNPKNTPALHGMAVLDAFAGRDDDAIEKLNAGISADSQHAPSHWLLGVLLERKGKRKEAIEQFELYKKCLHGASPFRDAELVRADAKIKELQAKPKLR